MTATLISLFSIVIGIAGANLTGFIFKKYSLGLIGNTIAGAFGSVFFIKFFGRFGFDPAAITSLGNINFRLFLINTIVSFLGAAIAVISIQKLKTKMNKHS
jgi:uncharacterized membrane protein YeaQ/YmgE (transglycosylase-associated protein family)